MPTRALIARPLRTALLTGCILSAWIGAWAFFVPDTVMLILIGIPYSFLLAFCVIGIMLCGRPLLVFFSLGTCTLLPCTILWAMLNRGIDWNSLGLFITIAATAAYAALALLVVTSVVGWVKFFVGRSA